MSSRVEKPCMMCNKIYFISVKGKFCEACKTIKKKETQRAYEEKNKTKKARARRKEFEDNFILVNPVGKQLIPNNFNEISKLSVSSYRKHYQLNWKEILERFGKKDELQFYLNEQYLLYTETTGSQDIAAFSRSINFHYVQLVEFDVDQMMVHANKKKMSYTEKQLRDNFLDIQHQLGRIPLHQEFSELSPIPIETYKFRFKMSGKIYRQLIEKYFSSEEVAEYLQIRLEHKAQVGRDNHQGEKYTLEELEENFRSVFDVYFNEIGEYPTLEIFNNLSLINESTYRTRISSSYSEVAKKYGYDVNIYGSSSEKYVIEKIGSLLDESPVTQQTFNWLRSDKGFNLRCDGYYPSYNLVVEYDGKQHFEPVEIFGGEEGFIRIQSSDTIKNKLIPQHNLTLIRIAYNEPYWDEKFLKQKLIENGINIPNNTINNNIA